MVDTPRRDVLAAAATGSALGLAGCGGLGGDGSAQTGDGAAEEDGGAAGEDDGSEEATATIALDVREEIQAAREEIGTRAQEENLSREDAQAELVDARAEILSEAAADVESYADGVDDLRVENANEQAGAVLVAGTPAAVLGTLEEDPVNALLSGGDFPEPESEQPNGS